MTRAKRTLFFTLSASIAVAAVAFTQAKARMEAAAPVVGTPAPAYALPDQDGTTHTLDHDRGHPILLAFYPADFTGGCTLEAHSLTSAYPALKAEGVTVYGVSVQDPKSHKSFCSKEGIPYTLLADTQKQMAAAYGVLIPGANIANRVTYIIGTDGKVAFVDKNVNGHLMTCGDDWTAWVKAHPTQMLTGRYEAVDEPGVTLSTNNTYIDNRVPRILGSRAVAVVGQPAPAFSLPDAATGTKTALDTLAPTKKATVVMFVSTRCPVSNAYNDRMAALAKKYSAQNVAFVGIDSDQNEPKAEIADFTKQHAFPFPVLVDAGNKVSDLYNAHVTPETYVIDSKGVLVYHGRIDNDMDPANVKTHDLANALDAVLAGKPIAKSQTKAFGCSIKRG